MLRPSSAYSFPLTSVAHPPCPAFVANRNPNGLGNFASPIITRGSTRVAKGGSRQIKPNVIASVAALVTGLESSHVAPFVPAPLVLRSSSHCFSSPTRAILAVRLPCKRRFASGPAAGPVAPCQWTSFVRAPTGLASPHASFVIESASKV